MTLLFESTSLFFDVAFPFFLYYHKTHVCVYLCMEIINLWFVLLWFSCLRFPLARCEFSWIFVRVMICVCLYACGCILFSSTNFTSYGSQSPVYGHICCGTCTQVKSYKLRVKYEICFGFLPDLCLPLLTRYKALGMEYVCSKIR